MTTAALPIDSDLKRKKWMREGLLQAASKSFFSSFTGRSKDSVVYQENNINASEGHTVVFDFEGNLSGKAVKGKETAYGKGETKKQFSSIVTVERYRLVVNNGDSFDGVDVGNLSITQHQDSRRKLADLFVRWKDQALFDAAQGNYKYSPSHTIQFTTTFGFNELLEIEKTLKTSQGFSSGTVRRPLEPYMTKNGEPVWLAIFDSATCAKLRQSSNFQQVVQNADYRGDNNRLIKGVIGKLGHLLIIEAPNFFGETNKTGSWGLNDTEVEIAGLRQYDSTNNAYTGQPGFDYASTLVSKNLILGAGALQAAFGKMPDYKFQESNDFGITSESALEVWCEFQKTRLKAEQKDYKKAKVANIDWGVVVVEVTI